MRILIALALTVACAAPVAVGDTTSADVLVLSPSPAAELATRAAAERWTQATGIEIVVAPGGVPVEYVADAIDPSGWRVCAHTVSNLTRGPISISVDDTPPEGKCRGAADTLAHEIGHALCHFYQPGASSCHVEHGLMRSGASTPEDYVLNAETLDAVCSVVPCAAFAPEG